MEPLYFVISWIVLPFYLTFLSWMYILRKIVFAYLTVRYNTRLVQLDSADIQWAVGEKYHNLINIIMNVNLKDSNDNILADIRSVLTEKLIAKPKKYAKILCSLNSFLGYPFLVKERVVADDYITIIDIDKTKIKSMKELMFSYSYKPLPSNNRLLFEIIVVKASKEWKDANDIKELQVPMLMRINHVIADGLSVMNLWAHTFGENDIKIENSLKNIPKSPEWQKLPIFQFLLNLLYFYLVPGFLLVNNFRREIKSITGQSYEGPMTAFRQNVSYGTEKPGEGLVQKIKSMKKQLGDTSFSEIILTAISASLYKYYQNALYKVPEAISTAIVATKDLKPMTINGVPQLRNQFGIVSVQMPIKLHTDSVLDRLEQIKKFTRKLMKDPSDLMISNFITFNLLQYLPTPFIKRLLPMKGYATVISNLPEFPKIVVFNGHAIEDAYFFTIQRDEMATGFAVVSYDSRLHLGFVGDIASIPSIADCDEIVSEFFHTFELLQTEIDKRRLNTS